MKFLVLGASGMAGHLISIYLVEQGHDVVGYSRKGVPFVKSVCGDARDNEKIISVLKDGKFDAVINSIGVLNQFAENDKENAVFINAYFPHFLAKVTEGTQTQIIHMSTDCVFSGDSAPYTEKSLRDGVTFYDRTKAMGELEDDKNLTFRNSIIGPDINENGIGLLNWFMHQDGKVNGYVNAIWTGLTTLQLAKTIEKAAHDRAHGLVNMVYKDNISKYELLKLMNHYIRKDKVQIYLYKDFYMDKTLVRTNYDFDCDIPDYEVMVSEMAKWMREHRDLYPHYML